MKTDLTRKTGNKKLLAVAFGFLLFSSYFTLATDAFGQVPTLQTINQQATSTVITGSQAADSAVTDATQTSKSSINTAAPLAISKIEAATQAAITSVNSASQNATAAINTSAKNATAQVNNAAGQILATASSVAQASDSAISKLNQTAIFGMATITPKALLLVATSNQTAIKNINNASSQTIFAITTANKTVNTYLSRSTQAVISAINTTTPFPINTINSASQNATAAINTSAKNADSQVSAAAGKINATVGSVAQAGTSGIGTVNQTAIGSINKVTPQAVSGIKFANSTVSAEVSIATPAAVGEIASATQAANVELSTASQSALSQINIINQAGISNQVTSAAASNVMSANNTATYAISNTGQTSSSSVTQAGQSASSNTSISSSNAITSVNSASQNATAAINTSAKNADSQVSAAAGKINATVGSVAQAGTSGIGTVNQTAIGSINKVTPQATSLIGTANQTSITYINKGSTTTASAIKSVSGQVITAMQANTPTVDSAISSAASAETTAINSASQNATATISASAKNATTQVNNAAGQLLATASSVAQAGTSGIGTVNQTAIMNINKLSQQAITEIKLANKTAITEINAETPSAISEINIIGQLALSEISQVNSTSIKEINTATSTATTVVGPTISPAINTVNNNITSATNTATGAVASTTTTVNNTAKSTTTTATGTIASTTSTVNNTITSTTSTAITTVNNTIKNPPPIPGNLIPTIPSSITSPSTPVLSSQTVPIPPSANYSVSQANSGLMVSDSLTNETKSQQQLQANPGYWTYGGDAPTQKAPYAFWRDAHGFHIGVEAPVNGTYSGYYALSQTHSMLYHSVITTPQQVVPSTNNYYENGMYVQNGTQNVSYVDCSSLSSQWGTGWTVELTKGDNFGANIYKNLWWSGWSKSGPLTRDCTIITNGTNYLKVYINGTVVYQNSTLNLGMSQPRVTFLEPQSNYAGQLLNGTFTTYYATSGESVKVTNNPPVASTVKLVEPTTGSQGVVVATSRIDSKGTATLPIGNYTMPLKAYVIVYDSSGNVVASTPQEEGLYGGDVYSVSGTPVSYAITFGISNATSTYDKNPLPGLLPPPQGLAATTVSSSAINLNWNAPSGTSFVVQGYNIQRSVNSGTTWTTIASNTPATTTTYLDSGLQPSTAYSYRVFAVYAGIGQGSPSNTASATTQSATYQLTVSSQISTGGALNGMYTTLTNSSGQVVQSGWTPMTFTLNNGAQYSVGIGNYAAYVFDHWGDTGSSQDPRQISISSDTKIVAIYKDNALQLSPSQGSPGTTVTATGTSFAPNHAVTLSWDGTALVTTPATVTSSSSGGFSATFQVPSNATNGSHMVSAADGSSTHQATFTVSSSTTVTLSATSVNVGTDVRVTGTNFASGSPITISFDGVPDVQNFTNDDSAPSETYLKADSSGNFAAVFETQRAVSGTHTISVQDSKNNIINTKVTVAPHVYLFPQSVKPGASVSIPTSEGNGYAANSTISIKFDGTVLALNPAITTDSQGNFGGSFTIPSTATTGSHTITVSDNVGNSYSASIAVDSNAHSFSSQVVATGFAPACPNWQGCNDVPAYFAFIPDGNQTKPSSGAFMVNEKNSGNVLVFKNANGQFVKQSVPFVRVPNIQVAYETNGLLGIAFDPNWASPITPEKWVYLYVTRNVTSAASPGWQIVGQLVRYHAITDSSGNIVADPSVPEQLILQVHAWQDGHNGGSLKFDSQGNLYLSTGDGWGFTNAQDLTSYQGKILRITPVYSQTNGLWYTIPSSNPFASSTNLVTQSIWAYGMRHPYAFDLDQQTGKLYASNVGYNAWENIENATAPGSNEGWPYYESPVGSNPDKLASYVPAMYWYSHEGLEPQAGPGNQLEALSAGAFYHGTTYPGLDGAYFFGDYGVGNIAALVPSSTAQPQQDQVHGVAKSQVVPVLYNLTLGPIYMEEWNGKLYYFDLTGNMNVLNYN